MSIRAGAKPPTYLDRVRDLGQSLTGLKQFDDDDPQKTYLFQRYVAQAGLLVKALIEAGWLRPEALGLTDEGVDVITLTVQQMRQYKTGGGLQPTFEVSREDYNAMALFEAILFPWLLREFREQIAYDSLKQRFKCSIVVGTREDNAKIHAARQEEPVNVPNVLSLDFGWDGLSRLNAEIDTYASACHALANALPMDQANDSQSGLSMQAPHLRGMTKESLCDTFGLTEAQYRNSRDRVKEKYKISTPTVGEHNFKYPLQHVWYIIRAACDLQEPTDEDVEQWNKQLEALGQPDLSADPPKARSKSRGKSI